LLWVPLSALAQTGFQENSCAVVLAQNSAGYREEAREGSSRIHPGPDGEAAELASSPGCFHRMHPLGAKLRVSLSPPYDSVGAVLECQVVGFGPSGPDSSCDVGLDAKAAMVIAGDLPESDLTPALALREVTIELLPRGERRDP
jgi:hypothetical protein